jgi:hypothetical protein
LILLVHHIWAKQMSFSKWNKRMVPYTCSITIYCVSSGFDINGCPIARGKWNASSGKWKRHPTCPIGQVKIILWYVQFLKSKMINIELFSVGSHDKFYLNIASYVSCILHHFVLFCWLRNSPFSNKDHVIYISQSWMPN